MCMPTTVDMSQIPSEAEMVEPVYDQQDADNFHLAAENRTLRERIRLLESENKQATIRIQYYLREIEHFEAENIMFRMDKVNVESEQRRTKIRQED